MATPPLPTASRYMSPDAVKFSVVALTSISAPEAPTNVAALTVNTSPVISATSSAVAFESVMPTMEDKVISPAAPVLMSPTTIAPALSVVNITSSLSAPAVSTSVAVMALP